MKVETKEEKLAKIDTIVKVSPLAMVAVGGAIGGVIGAFFWWLNSEIFKRDITRKRKYALAIMNLIWTVLGYLAAIFLLVIFFPEWFPE